MIFFNRFLPIESIQRAQTDSFVQEKPPRYTYPDPQTQAGRLQKQTDFLRLVHEIFFFFNCRSLAVVHIVLHHERAI